MHSRGARQTLGRCLPWRASLGEEVRIGTDTPATHRDGAIDTGENVVQRDIIQRYRHGLLALLVASVGLGAPSALAVDVGQSAPDFTLPSTSGQPMSLRQFKGKKNVLIQFYSMDFNPT